MSQPENSLPTRLAFVTGAIVGAGATGAAAYGLKVLAPPSHGDVAKVEPPVKADAPAAPVVKPASAPNFTDHSAALQPDRTVSDACPFCNSLCGLQVDLKKGRVLAVRGESKDPVQVGALCVKAELLPQLVYNRFRLKTPLKRVGGDKGSPDTEI